MRSLFGTDGIRGVAGLPPLDAATVGRIGAALVASLARGCCAERSTPTASPAPRGPDGGPVTIVLGCDTRESSPWIVAALSGGILSAGGRVRFAGVVPTPAVAHLVRAVGADAGISVSASHNPWQDNGIKVFAGTGRKLPDTVEAEIEREIDGAGESAPVDVAFEPALDEAYVDHLVASLPGRLDGLTVVVDAANGAAHALAPEAFRRAGARVVAIHSSPDGRNINERCGALHPEVVARAVVEAGADLGVALDGDADRAMLADANGRVLDGDDVLFLWALELEREGRKPGAVVGTVMSNFGLEKALAERGILLVRTGVGDRYVTEEMERRGILLGGEPSGHLIRSDLGTTGDGTLTGLLVAAGAVASGTPLTRLPHLPRTPQVLRNVRVAERLPFDAIPGFAPLLAECEERLRGTGRILVRYSGTEPLARVMVEGVDRAIVEGVASTLVAALSAEIGARA